MRDLKFHHALLNENAELKEELARVTEELRKARNSKNEWHCKYRKAVGETLTTADRTRIMIKHSKASGYDGSISDECRRISKVIGLSYATVRNHWYEKSTH